MSERAFKYFTITAGGTPQPLVGTTLSAAVVAPVASGSQLAVSDQLTTLPVVDSSMFLKGDYAMLDSVGALEERVRVFAVIDATHIQVIGMQFNHANGAFVRLAVLANSIYVQTKDGNVGAIFIGLSSAMVKATGVQVVAKLQQVGAGVQPTEFSTTRSGLGNCDDLGQLWVDGTTADSYLPSIGQV